MNDKFHENTALLSEAFWLLLAVDEVIFDSFQQFCEHFPSVLSYWMLTIVLNRCIWGFFSRFFQSSKALTSKLEIATVSTAMGIYSIHPCNLNALNRDTSVKFSTWKLLLIENPDLVAFFKITIILMIFMIQKQPIRKFLSVLIEA